MAQVASSESMAAGRRMDRRFEGLRWRIMASILVPIAWLSFTPLYVGFWAPGFTLFQSIIVIIVSALVLAGVLGAAWTTWDMGRREWFVP